MHICPKQHRKVYANTVTLCERLLSSTVLDALQLWENPTTACTVKYAGREGYAEGVENPQTSYWEEKLWYLCKVENASMWTDFKFLRPCRTLSQQRNQREQYVRTGLIGDLVSFLYHLYITLSCKHINCRFYLKVNSCVKKFQCIKDYRKGRASPRPLCKTI